MKENAVSPAVISSCCQFPVNWFPIGGNFGICGACHKVVDAKGAKVLIPIEPISSCCRAPIEWRVTRGAFTGWPLADFGYCKKCRALLNVAGIRPSRDGEQNPLRSSGTEGALQAQSVGRAPVRTSASLSWESPQADLPGGTTAPSGPRANGDNSPRVARPRGEYVLTFGDMIVLAVMAYCICILAVLAASLFTSHQWQHWLCGVTAGLSFCSGLHWSIQAAIIALADGIRRKQ